MLRPQVDEEEMKRRFAEHRASYVSFDSLERLLWRAPHTLVWSICYVRSHGTLLVYGDCGELVYQWSEALPLRQIAQLDLHYFCSKCRAWSDSWPRWGWSPERTQATLEQLALERGLPVGQLPDYSPAVAQTKEDWCAWLEEHGEDLVGSDFYELYDVGRVPSSWVEMHLAGLREAVRQLQGSKANG